MESNCQPIFHQTPNGKRVNFWGKVMCKYCGSAVSSGERLPGRWGEHVSRISGNYRLILLNQALRCPACGRELNELFFPCGVFPLEEAEMVLEERHVDQ